MISQYEEKSNKKEISPVLPGNSRSFVLDLLTDGGKVLKITDCGGSEEMHRIAVRSIAGVVSEYCRTCVIILKEPIGYYLNWR